MDAIQKAKQFQRELNELINRSLKDGVPIPSMIMDLSCEQLDLQLLFRDLRLQNEERELSKKIITTCGIPPTLKLPRPPGS